MEPADSVAEGSQGPVGPRLPLEGLAEPAAHRHADAATGVLLLGMVVFSPWALAGWPAWSVWCMNTGGYGLWLLLGLKAWARWRAGYAPPRWGGGQPRWHAGLLAALTVGLLAWCLVSAANARAIADVDALRLDLKPDYVPWLPHSFDAPQSWFAFWSYLGLAGVFWAARDWLTVQSERDRSESPNAQYPTKSSGLDALRARSRSRRRPPIPERVRTLLFWTCLNGGLVALVGILSTLDNPTKVMWMAPHETRDGRFFGPFWYRNNGAHFVNLLLPVCVGLWLALSRRHREAGSFLSELGKSPVTLLAPCAVLLGAAPFVIKSRGGSLIAVVLWGWCLLALWKAGGHKRWWILGSGLAVAVTLGTTFLLLPSPLKDRFLRGFFTFPTGCDRGWQSFTLRCVFEAPSVWLEKVVTVGGLAENRKLFSSTPRSVALNLRPEGRLEVRYMGERPQEYLLLVLTNATLATPKKMVELVLVHDEHTPRLYLDGQPLSYTCLTNRSTGFAWPKTLASSVLWVGRGNGGWRVYQDRIDTVTLLDRALSADDLATLRKRAAAVEDPLGIATADPWNELSPPPVLALQPQSFSPKTWFAEGLGGRHTFFRNADRMMKLYPAMFGSGPATFGSLYKVYLQNAKATDEWYVHDDYRETRLTFGLLGAGLIYAALVLVALRLGIGRGLRLPGIVVAGLACGLLSALFHARFDWVFQTHPILFLAILVCAVLSCTSVRRAP